MIDVLMMFEIGIWVWIVLVLYIYVVNVGIYGNCVVGFVDMVDFGFDGDE